MVGVVETRGHPRDMGIAQGRAAAASIQEAVSRAGLPIRRSRRPNLRAFTSGPARGAGVGRETIRHYTHLSERMDGLAQGAAVPVDSILALHAHSMAMDPTRLATRAAVAISAVGLRDSPGTTLARSLSPGAGPGDGLLVRRSQPEVGFESVEITLPWLAASLAGVNDAGLAAALVPLPGDAASPPSAAAPVLLVQESLQRFEATEAAVDWAMSRPSFGHGVLLIADANGARAAVRFQGERRVTEWAVEDAPQAAGRPEQLADALAQAAISERVLDRKAICPDGALASTDPGLTEPDAAESGGAFVSLIPTRRSLALERPGSPRYALTIEL